MIANIFMLFMQREKKLYGKYDHQEAKKENNFFNENKKKKLTRKTHTFV